jgi:adenylate cyclase
VREAIFGKLGLPLRDIGEKTLKNIDRPVHIYQIQAPGSRARRDWFNTGLGHYRRLAPSLGLVVLLVAVAGLAAWRFWPRTTAPPEYTPVMAVLPFTNASGDASLDLGPSLAREVSAMLATYPMFRVVPPSGLPPKRGEDIGRRYGLDGDFLKSGDRLRVRARLTDAASGETVWSDSHDFEGGDLMAIEKKTAERIYGVLTGTNGRLIKIEQEASWRKPESDLTGYDYYLRSTTYIMKLTYDNALRARKIAEEGLKRFPESALIKLRLAWSYLIESDGFGSFENCRDTIGIAYKLGREVEEAKNKSRFEIYQTRRFMARAYAWHGMAWHGMAWRGV